MALERAWVSCLRSESDLMSVLALMEVSAPGRCSAAWMSRARIRTAWALAIVRWQYSFVSSSSIGSSSAVAKAILTIASHSAGRARKSSSAFP